MSISGGMPTIFVSNIETAVRFFSRQSTAPDDSRLLAAGQRERQILP
jgi:hypothetical protein